MPFLRSVVLPAERRGDPGRWPWTLPAVRALEELPLDRGVTILVGENGAGKSTLLEAIAVAAGLPVEGGSAAFGAHTHDAQPELADALRLVRGAERPVDSVFLRAESFFGLISEIDEQGATRWGPTSLHTRSHGEGFLDAAMHRLGPRGLYLLDEPESALSAQSCLAFLGRVHELVAAGAQFLIATHSPILLGIPGATLIEVSERGLEPIAFDDAESVQLTRAFLQDRERFLHHLLG